MGMMWNPKVETLPRERLRALQLERLRQTVDRLLASVPLQRERLHAAGIRSGRDLASLDDLGRLPFTRKSDLRDTYPYGLFAVPREEVVRIHASSGTRGKPTLAGYTRNDLEVWTEVMARCLAMGGVRRGMVVHNAHGYGLFTGGLGIHQGAERMGCTVVPASAGLTRRQVMLLRDLGGQVLACTPSYALNLAQAMRELGVSASELRLEVGFFGAEPWTEAMRDQIERELGLVAINLYGLSEIVGPGVAGECREACRGAHIQDDHFLAEVVDSGGEEPRPEGEEGELVLTTLTKEALPLLRYRTGDVTALDFSPCACGRTSVRMARVRGRYDDMLIIRGVNLYPSEVERILLALEGAAPHYQILVERPAELDELTVLVEPSRADLSRADLQRQAERALYEQTGLRIAVRVLDSGSIPRSEGKAVRVVDRRPT